MQNFDYMTPTRLIFGKESMLKSLMVNARKCLDNPEDYTARAEMMLCCTYGCNGILSLGATPAPRLLSIVSVSTLPQLVAMMIGQKSLLSSLVQESLSFDLPLAVLNSTPFG